MAQNHNLQHDYIADLLNAIPLNTTGEIAVSLSVEITSPMGFIIIDRGVNNQEERMLYHRKNSNTVFVYSSERTNPRQHDIGAKVILDSISSINYAHDNGFEQMYIFRKSESDVIIKGGQFYINGEMITISDLDTELGTQHLSLGQDNYIYIKDNDYYVTTTIDNNLYLVGIVSVEVSGSISNIDITNALPMGGGMTSTERSKLDGLDSSQYEKLTNKTSSIRDVSTADDTKYPTEKAVATELDNKVNKDGTKVLSDNDFTNTLKNKLDELITLDLPNKDLGKTNVVGGTGIVVDDLGSSGWRVSSNTTHGVGVVGDNIEIFPLDSNVKTYHKNGQRYVILEDEYRSGIYGSVKFKDGNNPTVSVYYNNPNNAGKILIDTQIKVVDALGHISEHHESIPYEVNIDSGDGVFNLLPQSFTGLDYTSSTVMYIKINRVGAFVTDVNGTEFNDIINDEDTVKGELRISSMFIDYEGDIVTTSGGTTPSGEYSYEHVQTGASDTWTINHGLDTKKLIIQCYDDLGKPIDEDTYYIVDTNNIIIYFTGNISGTAVILSSGGTLTASTAVDKNYTQTFANLNGGGSFNHGLGKYPSVIVLDGVGNEVVSSVKHDDINNVTITWIGVYSGKVVAN